MESSSAPHYPVALPDHLLEGGSLEHSTATWSSPAESMFSDFSYQLEGSTPPPSPSLPRNPFGYDAERSMDAPHFKVEKHASSPLKRRVQKRPARQAHSAPSPSRQGSEDKQSTPGSPDSDDNKTEKTPAQKMRRLIQNRISQRNFRQRQASRRHKLEEQVEELQKRNKMYEDLLMKYEQMLRASSDSNGSAGSHAGGAAAEFRDLGLL